MDDSRELLEPTLAEEAFGQRMLRIVGCTLIVAGLLNGVGIYLLILLTNLAYNFWWAVTATVLAFAFRDTSRQRIGRVLAFSFLAIGIISRLDQWALGFDEYLLGFMLTILGLILLLTNDPNGQSGHVFRSCGVIINKRRMGTVTLCVAGLWVANPENSHSMCLKASSYYEKHEAYDSAIVFTKLARDTFPPNSFCGTCNSEINNDLSRRIEMLKARNAGFDISTKSASDSTNLGIGHRSISVRSRR